MTPQTARTLETRALLRDEAVREANRLRAEALDDFWQGANGWVGAWADRWLVGGFGKMVRAALRLQQRLERRRLNRLLRGL